MAAKNLSSFLYNLEVNSSNQNLPFKASFGGLQLNAVLATGFYSLTGLLNQISAAMKAVDPGNNYTVTADRTVDGGTQNRITIATSGSYLDLLFSSGTTAASSCRDLISFGIFDYTGATSYQNGATSGIILIPERIAYNYQPPQVYKTNFGTVNVSANGTKEAIVWSLQQFIGLEFKYEPESKVLTEWADIITWWISQKPFDFTPDITDPDTVYDVTLEKSQADGKGLGFNMREMLPAFPFMYQTGPLIFRIRPED